MPSVTSAAQSNSSIDLLPLVALGSSVNYVHLTGFDMTRLQIPNCVGQRSIPNPYTQSAS